MSLRLVRSPLAPKITMTHGDAAAVVSGWCEFMDEVSAFGLMTPQSATALFFLYVAAKLKAHGGQNLGCKIGFTARGEALVERFGEHRGRRAGFDGGKNGPTTFAGVRDFAGEFFEFGRIEKRNGGKVEEPGSDYAAAAPDFSDIGQIEFVLIVLGVAQRCGFGVALLLLLADVGVLEDVKAFGVGGHQAVFDAVVDHLYEVPGAGRAAVEVAVFGGSDGFFSAGSAIHVAATRRERFENGVEVFDDIVFAADHLAIAAFEAPNTAAG